MRYPKSFLDKIKDSLPISQIIRKKTKLEKTGKYYRGLCQFHDDTNPSMIVDDARGSYHCFSCGAHGDAFSFVQGTEGLSFTETIEKLAGEAGLELPKLTQAEVKRFSQEDRIIELNEAAAKFYQDNLYKTGRVTQYLKDRGLDKATCEKFKIGYAPDSWDSLRNHLVTKGYQEDELVKADLLVKKDNKSYDRFRDRIMFPIQASNGKIIAFGGRIIDKGEPKYLNSGETLVFNKSNTLYGLNHARGLIYKENKTVVSEGYTDVIALHQAGFTNAVAPLGTAFTVKHLKKIWTLSDEAVICLDGDDAGVKAMQRAAELALSNFQIGKTMSFCILPKGADPDSLIKKEGSQAFSSLLDEALVLSDFLFVLAMQKHNPSSPEEFLMVEKELIHMAVKLEDREIRSKFVGYLKSRLDEYRKQSNYKLSGKRFGIKSTGADLATTKYSQIELREIFLLGTVIYNENIFKNAEVFDFLCENRFINEKIDKIRQNLIETSTKINNLDYNSTEFDAIKGHYEKTFSDSFYAKLAGGNLPDLFKKDNVDINYWRINLEEYKKDKLIKNLDINKLGNLDDDRDFQESYELIRETRGSRRGEGQEKAFTESHHKQEEG